MQVKKSTSENFLENNKRSFILRLVLKHPKLSLEEVSAKLGIEHDQGYSVGTPRKTPRGTSVGNFYKETFFGVTKKYFDRNDFFNCSTQFASSFSQYRDFFMQVNTEGGKVGIYIDLIGGANIGDVIKPKQLEIFSQLGIELGIEVFP